MEAGLAKSVVAPVKGNRDSRQAGIQSECARCISEIVGPRYAKSQKAVTEFVKHGAVAEMLESMAVLPHDWPVQYSGCLALLAIYAGADEKSQTLMDSDPVFDQVRILCVS